MIATLGSVRLGIINKCIIITIKKQKKRVARISGFKKTKTTHHRKLKHVYVSINNGIQQRPLKHKK